MEYDCSLVNGTDCTPSAGLSKFKFQSGKRHRLRLINGGAEGLQKFAIDNHTMTIIANDFVPVKPYNAQVVTLGVGQRTDIIVEGTGDSAGAFWMRSTVSSAATQIKDLHLQPYTMKTRTPRQLLSLLRHCGTTQAALMMISS